MPSFYQLGEYDLAGFCVGIVEKKSDVGWLSGTGGRRCHWLGKSGVHSNGFGAEIVERF